MNAPLPFIVGVDSRYFDFYEPPLDVICVDLDTNSIYLSENKRSLNVKSLPKRPTRTLKNTLDRLFDRLTRPSHQGNGTPYNSQTKARISTSPFSTDTIAAKKVENQISLEIQEAFVRFMATIMCGFRSYLLPITRAPTVGATDTESLFDVNGFLKSRDKNYHRFYQLLMKTQMFTRFIEERSFVSDKDTSLAFFDECLDKIEALADTEGTVNLRLIDADGYLKNDRTVFIPAPEPNDEKVTYSYHSFGPFNPEVYHVHPVPKGHARNLTGGNLTEAMSPSRSTRFSISTGSPLSRRTKHEIRAAQRVARRHSELPLTWSKCLVSYCYSLWFIQLPAYVKGSGISLNSQGSPLRVAVEVLQRMQALSLHPLDEVCYRVLMLLCGEYSQPVLAVKVLFEMKQNGVVPNAITYGYYNKAVLESKWPAGDTTAALLWTRLRNVVYGVNEFKRRGRQSSSRKVSVDESNKTPKQALKTPEMNITPASERKGVSERANFIRKEGIISDKINFRESNEFRKRTGSIVRASPTTLGRIHDFDSSAGVLISTTQVFACDIPISERKAKRLQCPTGISKINENPKKTYARSLSFGHDAGIISNVREEALKALKLDLENVASPAPDPSPSLAAPSSRSLDLVEEVNEVETKDGDAAAGSESFVDPLTAYMRQDEEMKRQKELKEKEKEAASTPAKGDLSITGLFSPDSKFASSIRSGFRVASQRISTPAKSSMARSLTFAGASDKMSKIGSLFRSKTIADESYDSTPQKQLNRSATLPTSLEGRDRTSSVHSAEDLVGSESSLTSDNRVPSQKSKASEESLSETSESGFAGSPWATKLSTKHFEYVNSTIKSAASSMASRISEIKSNFTTTTSATSSPSKATPTANSSVIGGTASLLSQWANKVTEKAFAFDEEDWGSNSSLDGRRLSNSEDDVSERSREGSFARIAPGERFVTGAPNSIFETLETHYINALEPTKSSAVKLIEVEMSSCCRCFTCSAVLFDEEIMEGWSADDSNLNSMCSCCNTPFVPLLAVNVKVSLLVDCLGSTNFCFAE